MRAFAWVRVQRAELARALGDPERAGRLLADAERAYPGWWYVAAHRAALDLPGRWDAGDRRYRGVLAEVDRPEFREALGTAFARAGRAEWARSATRAPCAEYLVSADRGEVHYLHHLAAYHADVRPTPSPPSSSPGGTSPCAATGRRCRCSPGACIGPAVRRRRAVVVQAARARGRGIPY